MHELIDAEINNLYTDGEQHSLLFYSRNKGYLMYEAYGDCCSETWFSDIYNLSALRDAVVTNVEEINTSTYNTEDGRSRQDADRVYGYKLTTTLGHATIVFRNSSNGYYGGSLNDVQMFSNVNLLPRRDWIAIPLSRPEWRA